MVEEAVSFVTVAELAGTTAPVFHMFAAALVHARSVYTQVGRHQI